MQAAGLQELLTEFRAARRAFESRLRGLSPEQMTAPHAPGEWSPREVVVHIAAWLGEAGERIPAVMAGAPSKDYDVDAFNAAAIRAAVGWSPEQVLGAYKRAADRFEAIAAELSDDDLHEEPDVRAWLESAARVMITEHLAALGAAVGSRQSAVVDGAESGGTRQ